MRFCQVRDFFIQKILHPKMQVQPGVSPFGMALVFQKGKGCFGRVRAWRVLNLCRGILLFRAFGYSPYNFNLCRKATWKFVGKYFRPFRVRSRFA
jgi:hypothetical protein